MGDMISGVRMPGGWEQNVEYKAQAAAGLRAGGRAALGVRGGARRAVSLLLVAEGVLISVFL